MPVTLSEAGGLSGSGTLNYLPKWTPDGFTLGNSIVYDDGTNVGFGTTSPTARGHFKGSTSVGVLPTDYAAKFDNSSNAPLLHIRNDGNVGIGTTSPNAKLSFGTYYINGVPSSSEQASHIKLYDSGGVLFGFGVSTNSARDYLNIAANNINGNIAFYTNGLNNIIINQNGRLGIRNKSTQNVADLAILTEDNSNSKYSIYIENTISSPILTVRNDGNIGVGTFTPTSKLHVVGLPTYANNAAAIGAGLTAGAMYIRTGHGLDIVV